MAEHNELGKIGENIAFSYLKDHKYTILHRNFRIGRAEFDFIVRNEKGELCFVEVKTLRSPDEHPEVAVSRKKESMLKDGAANYKEAHQLVEESFFEILAINYQSERNYKIFHIKDALY